MAGARSLHIRDRLNPVPNVIRTTRWGLQSEEHRSVPHEEILGDALGEYVGGIISARRISTHPPRVVNHGSRFDAFSLRFSPVSVQRG